MNIKIRQRRPQEHLPMCLLLLADPCKKAISTYIENSQYFFAESNNEIVGVIATTATSEHTQEIKNIAVKESFQHQGIGKQLILRAIKAAQNDNQKFIEICTGNSSLHQLFLYQRCGFRIVGIEPDFFRLNYNERIYENGIECRDRIRLRIPLQHYMTNKINW